MLRGPVQAPTFPALDHFPREAGSSGHVYPFSARSVSPIMPQAAAQDKRGGLPASIASATFWRSPYSDAFRQSRSSSSSSSRGRAGADSAGLHRGGGADAGHSRGVSPGQRSGSAQRSPLQERNDGGQEKIGQDAKGCATSSSTSAVTATAGTLDRRKSGSILKGGGGGEEGVGGGGGGGGVEENGGRIVGGGGVGSEGRAAGMDSGSDTSSENVRQIRGILCKSSVSSSSRQSGSKIQKRVKFDDCVDNRDEENGPSCRSPHSSPNIFNNGVVGGGGSAHHSRHDQQHEHLQHHHHNPHHHRSVSASAVPCVGGGRSSALVRMPSLRHDGDRLQSIDKSCLSHSHHPHQQHPGPASSPVNPHHHPHIPRPSSGPLIRTSSVPDLTLSVPKSSSRGGGAQSPMVQPASHTPHAVAAAAAAYHLLQGPATASQASPYPHNHHPNNMCAPSSAGSSRVTSSLSTPSSHHPHHHHYHSNSHHHHHLHHHPALEFRIIRQQVGVVSSCGSPRVSDTGLPQPTRQSPPPAIGGSSPQTRTPRFFASSRSHSTGPRGSGGGPLVRLSRSLTSPAITFQRPVKRSTLSSSSSSRARDAESLPMVAAGPGQQRGLVSSAAAPEFSSHHHHQYHHRHQSAISSRGGGDGILNSRGLDGGGALHGGWGEQEVGGACGDEDEGTVGKEEEEQEIRESFLDDDKTVQILNWLQEVDHKQAREGRCPVFVNHNVHRES